MTPTHRFNPSTKRIEAIPANQADANQADDQESQSNNDEAIDAYVSASIPKFQAFLKDLLVAYENQEKEPAEQSNPDESRVRQASTAQLARGTESEGPEQSEESEPDEEEPRSARGKTVRAFRNGRQVAVGG